MSNALNGGSPNPFAAAIAAAGPFLQPINPVVLPAGPWAEAR